LCYLCKLREHLVALGGDLDISHLGHQRRDGESGMLLAELTDDDASWSKNTAGRRHESQAMTEGGGTGNH